MESPYGSNQLLLSSQAYNQSWNVSHRSTGSSFPNSQSHGAFHYLDEQTHETVTLSNQSAGFLQIHNQSGKMYNRTLLWQLNNEMLVTLLPAVLYLVILMLLGSVGNFLVVYIFGWRLRASTQNCLFMWLGVFDVISCVIGMPSEIVDISHYFLYENAAACKTMRFLLTIPPIASANLLVVIAIDRYRRVCKPLHFQLEISHARIGVGVSALVAVVVAGPAVSLYGNRTVETSVPGLRGCDCSVQDKYQGRLYPLLYEMVFGASFLVYTVVLAVLYCRLWRETRRHRRYMATHSITSIALSSLVATSEADDTSAADSPGYARKTLRSVQSEPLVKSESTSAMSAAERADGAPEGTPQGDQNQQQSVTFVVDDSSTAECADGAQNASPTDEHKESESVVKNCDSSAPGRLSRGLQSEPLLGKKNGTADTAENNRKVTRNAPSELSVKIRKSLRASKLSVLAVAVTVVFVVSYLPHLCLIIKRTVVEDLDHQLTGAKLVFYNIFLRSYFVNSVANVFVYSAMNTEFRLQCRQLFLCSCVKRQTQRSLALPM